VVEAQRHIAILHSELCQYALRFQVHNYENIKWLRAPVVHPAPFHFEPKPSLDPRCDVRPYVFVKNFVRHQAEKGERPDDPDEDDHVNPLKRFDRE
jgi:hypothetical protein